MISDDSALELESEPKHPLYNGQTFFILINQNFATHLLKISIAYSFIKYYLLN